MMSTSIVRQVVTDFLHGNESKVLAISGAWGAGKTYTVKKLVEEYNGKKSLGWYSYVSLFGLRSATEIPSAIIGNIQLFPMAGLNQSWGDIFSDIRDWKRIVKGLVSKFLFLKGKLGRGWFLTSLIAAKNISFLGIGAAVSSMEAIFGAGVRSTIICIDDLERISNGLGIEEVMGLISDLCEQKKCRVLLIYNEAQFSPAQRDVFNAISEKVIDQKLVFSIDCKEAMDFGLSDKVPYRELLTPVIDILDIRNIRVLKKIERAAFQVFEELKSHSSSVKEQVATSICIFAVSLYESARGFPSIEAVKKYNSYSVGVEEKLAESASKVRWEEIFRKCNFRSVDDLNGEVLQIMQNGYVFGSKIREIAEKRNAIFNQGSLRLLFPNAWDQFHNSIDIDAKKLASAFSDAVEKAAELISSGDINNTVMLLRELNLNEAADNLITLYINRRSDHSSLLKNLQMFYSEKIDEQFKDALLAKATDDEKKLTLADAEKYIRGEGPWDEGMIPLLLKKSPEEIVEILRAGQGRGFSSLIPRLYNLPFSPEDLVKFRETVDLAIRKVAQESRINQIRMKKYLPPITQ